LKLSSTQIVFALLLLTSAILLFTMEYNLLNIVLVGLTVIISVVGFFRFASNRTNKR
jgi:hypothetical protein